MSLGFYIFKRQVKILLNIHVFFFGLLNQGVLAQTSTKPINLDSVYVYTEHDLLIWTVHTTQPIVCLETSNFRSDDPNCFAGNKVDDWYYKLLVNNVQKAENYFYGNKKSYSPSEALILENGLRTKNATYSLDTWEEDNGISGFQSGEDEHPCYFTNFNVDYIANGNPGIFNYASFTCSNSSVATEQFMYIYRHYKGDNFADALDFGTKATGTDLIHYNLITSFDNPSGAVNLNYNNILANYNIGGIPRFTIEKEVVYKFTLTECTKLYITGGTSSAITNHLVKMQGNTAIQYINSFPSWIYVELDAGTYAVVLEGSGSFTINISDTETQGSYRNQISTNQATGNIYSSEYGLTRIVVLKI